MGKDVAVKGLVLALCFEVSLVRGTSSRVSQCSLGGGSGGVELGLPGQFSLGVGFGTRIADLRSEVCLTYLLENDFGVFADFSSKICKWNF